MRLWRLDHGQYAVREGLDADQDGKLDGPARERSAELARFSTLPVSLPAKAVWLISMNQTKALDDVTARPDLAVCADDARYDPEAGVLTVVVHSIGAKPTGPFRLRATAGGKTLLDRKDMASLEAPADLNPRTVAVRIEGLKGLEKTPVVIELDPDGVIAEITEANNRVEVTPANAPRPEKAAKPAAAQAYLTSNQ
jgi:hypothetical protein